MAMELRRLADSGFGATVDALLYWLSVYGVPAIVGLASLLALVLLQNQYPLVGAEELELSSLQQEGPPLTPPQALARLAAQLPNKPAEYSVSTHLSEAAFWFSVVVPASDQPSILELPSRHALEAACWRATDFHPLGSASRATAEGAMKAAKTGFVLELGPLPTATRVLCRASHNGPAHLSAILWPEEQFQLSELKFHRNSGLLDGGLLVLSLFVLMTAIISREWLYVLFAAWLVANLRLAALSGGWDTQWLEHSIPPDWLIPMRKLTTALCYVLTIVLFVRLFGDDVKRMKYGLSLRVIQWLCLPLLLAAGTLPFAYYLPVLWVCLACMVAVIFYFLIRIRVESGSRVVMWYGLGLAVALLSNFNEALAASVGFRSLLGGINSVSGALLSSVLSALAIAEQIRQERLSRMDAQDELRHIYESVQVGLFSLDEHGRIVRTNPAYQGMMGMPADASGHWADGFEAGAWERLQALASSPIDADIELKSRADREGRQRSFLVRATLVKGRIEGSLQDITVRVEATANLSKTKEILRTLSAHGEKTMENERKHIAREIHDELGQHLTVLQMGLSVLRMNLDRNSAAVSKVDNLLSTVAHSINIVRYVATNLRPAALDLGLLPALEWLAEDFSHRWEIDCRLDVSGDPVALDDAYATVVFRIAQESLTNVARHACASVATIDLNYSDHKLSLQVRDNGKGFDPSIVRNKNVFGLLGMRERIRALGGEMRVDTEINIGTTISIELTISDKTDD
jgi:signal transduction histidine kinase